MIENNREGIFKLMLELVSVPSISATQGELKMARVIYGKLEELPYFKNHRDYLRLLPIDSDPLGRQVVFALVKAAHEVKKTIILTCHYDVVAVQGYGALKEYAFDPMEYTRRLSKEKLPEDVEKDLESGNYIFGRGVSDMKCGLAIEMALLAEAARDPSKLYANLAFLAVPDEENNSTGMRSAVSHLVELKKELDLDYIAAINCEPSGPGAPDADRRYIFTGTIGKIMPFFYFVGKETHVGDYFNGLNSTLITSYLNIAMEGNPDFMDFKGNEVFPPPTCLKLKDLRDAYSVTLPERAAAYYNLLTVSKSPAQILESMKRVAAEAFSMAVGHLKKVAASYSKKSGQNIDISWQAKVITFGELVKKACQNFPGNMSEHVKHYIASLPTALDERDKAISLVGELLKYYPEKGPMIVVGFLPPYYPHRGNLGLSEKEKNVMKTVDEVIEEARQSYGIEMKVVEYFAGITDLSYFGFQGKDEELKALSENMPGWGEIYDIPIEKLAKLDIPVLNLGPSGKDDHKCTERLELSYSLDITPRLLKFAVESIGRHYELKD